MDESLALAPVSPFDLLARLADRFKRAGGPDDLAEAAVGALVSAGLAGSVLAVEKDVVRPMAIALGAASGYHGLDDATAEGLLALRVPADASPALREPIRRRTPYVGDSNIVEALRALSGLGDRLSGVSDGTIAVAPVEAAERVVALVCAWGPTCSADVLPMIESVAALLGTAWERSEKPNTAGAVARRPVRRLELRRSVEALLVPGRMRAALQPVVRLYDGATIAFEALVRFPASGRISCPDDLFAAAAALGAEREVDLACIRAALEEARHIAGAPLFLNVTTRTLLDAPDFAAQLTRLLDGAGVEAGSTVLEISERDPVADLVRLQRVTSDLRAAQFRIAVDDAGAGHASMQVVAELRPDYIKVDRGLIRGVESDNARRALVVSLLSFAGHIGARLIAEGVETSAEQEVLLGLGVQFGQGWHLSRPAMAAPAPAYPGTDVVDAAWFADQRRRAFDLTEPATPLSVRVVGPAPPRHSGPRRRQALSQALSDAAMALQNEHDRLRILTVMAEQMQRVVPVDELAIYAADYEAHRFVPLYATGPDADQILADSFSMDTGVTGYAFARGLPELIPDSSRHPAARQIPGTQVTEESMLLVPLVAGDRKLGMINCYRAGVNRFNERELRAATLFAHVAAAAWRNAQLYSQLIDAAMTDPLTGLLNTRWLADAGDREVAQSLRTRSPLTVLLVDLDHFKSVNDSSGHAAGDAVLRRVARCLASSVRRGDAVVRFGGEEFLVVLRDTDERGAQHVASTLQTALRTIRTPPACAVRTLTASIGGAVLGRDGADLDSLVRVADAAMYAAKHAGRDRVVLGDAGSVPVVVAGRAG